MNRFLCLGECMVELAPTSDGLYRMGYAGDTFNCAWYARQLLGDDWTVQYGTVVGQDAASDGMLEYMENHGIDTSTIRRVPDRTVGLYSIQLKNGERSFSYWRGEAAARLLADDEAWLDSILKDRQVIQFSGITLAILSPEKRQVLARALARAREGGALVAFDTNLRPKLWESEQAMRDGLVLGASVADVVLPSFDEEEACFGDKTQADTIARYREVGAKVIAVKNGKDTCHVWAEGVGESLVTPAVVTNVVDSTAAGDSFAGGFLVTLVQGATAAEATKEASELAAQVIQRRGALAPDIFGKGHAT
ncbi:sugar kinase [Pelagimonas varians]|uniref:2-dehydro-3-deoxygluconokinase n=1 Tax=Pelagimonas varians TaxID=696760 RepID=A0A238KUP4_9RHOB|nr:sugar kinase [Pelagimonas varians]PYG28304.1 2-keto-3-deoxygluconate kinase [Pelagimonas varians]SMX46427.1 2-dehydro-3-deoxygluconokinase [Pelagimonas varians]